MMNNMENSEYIINIKAVGRGKPLFEIFFQITFTF